MILALWKSLQTIRKSKLKAIVTWFRIVGVIFTCLSSLLQNVDHHDEPGVQTLVVSGIYLSVDVFVQGRDSKNG